MVLAGMVEEKCDATDLITAAAGPKAGSDADIMIEEELAAEHMYAVENDVEQELRFGLRTLIGFRIVEVQNLPVNVDDVAKSEQREV